MKGIYAVLFLGIIFLLVPVGADQPDAALNGTSHQEMKVLIGKVSDEIMGGLSALERENQKNITELSQANLTGPEVLKILNTKVAAAPYAHSSLIITKDGIVTAAVPAQFSSLVGEDLSYQSAVSYANSQKKTGNK